MPPFLAAICIIELVCQLTTLAILELVFLLFDWIVNIFRACRICAIHQRFHIRCPTYCQVRSFIHYDAYIIVLKSFNRKEWIRSTKPYPISLSLKKLKDILDVNKPMDPVVRLLPCNGAELTKLYSLCLMKWSRAILPVMPLLWSNM